MSTTSPRSRWATLAPAALFLWPALATAVLEIPDSPLFLTSAGVTPNMVITLDDSGSMAWGRIPDNLAVANRFAKSPFNPAYYNPETIYRIPPDINGNPVAATTFGAALLNGFHPARGTVNLATAYRPTNEFLPHSGGHSYMNHYNTATSGSGISDPIVPGTIHTDVGDMIGVNSGTNAPYFVINDFANVDGSASGDDPGTNIVSVWVGGQFTQAQYDGTFTGTCNTSTDPGSVNRYKTQISGSTLTLCFRDDNAMYGKQVTITHQDAGGVAGYVPVRLNANAAAYYYVFDATNPIDRLGTVLCDPINTTHRSDNDCYDLRMVGQQPGPADLDNDGDVDGDDERQNFANWYSFYRIRNLMTLSAAAFAFRTVPETSRIAWQAINTCRGGTSTLATPNCRGWDNTVPVVNNAIRPFADAHRTNFYNWLFRLPANGSTPLLNAMERVGRYYQTQPGHGNPYDDDLTDPANNRESTCRRNYHILMTDGIWNNNAAFQTAYGNVDGTARTLPDGINYSPRAPFTDTNPTTATPNASLADIAFYYWANDLRTNLANAVPSYVTDFSGDVTTRYFNPKNNPASWQHLVNYNIGLGLSGFLRPPSPPAPIWAGDTYAGSYNSLVAGTLPWPTTQDNAIPGNVADLWHAALNSRGKFYSAEDPDDLIEAFQDIMNSITTQAASGGGAGLSSNTSQIDQEGALIFEAKFNADWSGQLLARPVDDQFNLQQPLWDAGERIPAPYERRIFTLNDEPVAIRLEATCPGGPLKDALTADSDGDEDERERICIQRTNWFRGDGRVEGASAAWRDDPPSGFVVLTFEVTDHGYRVPDKLTVDRVTVSAIPVSGVDFNGTFTVTAITDDSFSVEIAATELPGTYTSGGRVHYTDLRNRSISVLGDIMNSDPVYSDGGDFGYGGAEVRPSEVAYAAFVAAKEGIPPVIYAGANDGMLHAFCAQTPESPQSCPAGIEPGEELFAYIPQATYGNLSALTDPQYAHRYYVDGQISVADAYLGGAWGTYLVGALGAGGKGIFALDVSDPVGFAAADVKWEFTDADNLGLTFSKPQIARTAIDAWGERWGVIFGNGYNSTSDRAYLFVVDLADGSPIAEIAAGNEAANGLSTPYLHDSNGDTVVDAVYAGDLRGNLWKFVNTDGTWSLGNGGQPLFTARNAQNEVQPITAQPVVSAHPSGGVLVYFGTGSYLTACDIGDPVNCTGTYDDQQAFYAIWDNGEVGTVAPADLERYSILTETTAFGYQVRTTSEGTVNWQEDRGWYLDLPRTPDSPAERVVSPAIVLEFTAESVPDRILFVTSTPSSDPCTMGGTSWLMELALVTGGRPASPIFDLDKSGSFDSNDTIGGAAPSGVAINSAYGITGEPLILTTEGGNIYKAFSGTTGKSGIMDASPMQQGEPPPSAGAPTRVYWRQIQ